MLKLLPDSIRKVAEGSQYLASGRLEAGLGQVCVKAIIEIQISIFWKSRLEKLRCS